MKCAFMMKRFGYQKPKWRYCFRPHLRACPYTYAICIRRANWTRSQLVRITYRFRKKGAGLSEENKNNIIWKDSQDSFVKMANEVLNRRKSRAGKSLEHHLADIFTHNELVFEEQAITEDNKKPDFLFPNSECYHNLQFPADDLVVLGAKTTCKDRWRQVLSEADRVDSKYLFTLQQGVSKNQLKEMQDSRLTLVVPHQYISSFPIEYQSTISDLTGFIQMVRKKQESLPKYHLI